MSDSLYEVHHNGEFTEVFTSVTEACKYAESQQHLLGGKWEIVIVSADLYADTEYDESFIRELEYEDY